MSRVLVDSGIDWIGKIPDNWNYIKCKYLTSITTGKKDANNGSEDGQYPFFTCSMENKKISTYSFDTEALLVAGNGVVGYTRYYKGKFDAYQRTYVLDKFNKKINPIFLKYYFNGLLSPKLEADKVGSVIDFIKLGDLKNFIIVLPNINEQTKIAEYLDYKCSKIDQVIEDNKKSIKLLEEYSLSLIGNSIRHGIDDSQLKNSGISYIGSIPINWNIICFGKIFNIKKEIAGKEGYNVLSITQQGIIIKDIESNEGQLASDYSKYQFVNVDDFAMNHMDLLTGWVDCSKYFGVTSPDYRVFEIKNMEILDKRYCLYYLQLCYKERIFYAFGQGVSNLGRWRLPRSSFNNTYFPLPSIEEQKNISKYLDNRISKVEKVIKYRKQIIKKLEEYKKSLIYECVTGKREV